MLGDDLFPKDFIHLLEPPNNYVGMNALFAPGDPEHPDHVDDDAQAAGLRPILDADLWLPMDHKQDVTLGALPESLKEATGMFLLSCAIRDLRQGAQGAERGIHRSMLVNVSRFTAVQNKVADAMHAEIEHIREQVRLYGKLPAGQAAKSQVIAKLQNLFDDEFAGCGFNWPSVLGCLHEAISPVKIQPVNQGTGAASLDYSVVDKPPGIRVIAVGGNSLSRGLTLEGLCVSYVLRNSKAYPR